MTRRAVPTSRLEGLLGAEGGLTSAEAQARRQRYGANDVVERAPGAWRRLVRETAADPMIWFLAGTGALYVIVGQRVEALTILAAIVPLVGMDAFLHRRTQASTAGLASRLAARATIVRDGVTLETAAADIVPGDLALVGAGEPFPADGLVVAGRALQADESSLTGEAYAVAKRPLDGALPAGAEPVVGHEHWGFAGTRLLTGRASLRVVFTGGETLYGEIVRSAGLGAGGRTPLQEEIRRLVTVLVAVAALVCVVLAAVRLRQGHGWVDALVSAVTLAAAAIPEEFPVVFAFFLGVGVYRLAKRQALVRRAVTVENIGRVSCICSDKTGTLTEGRLRLTHLLPAGDTAERRLLALAALASRAETGDPLDAAIAQEAAGVPALAAPADLLSTFPFTEDRRRETAVVRTPDGLLAATKGAAETVLAMSTLSATERDDWNRRSADLAEDGHKVIACGWRWLDAPGPGAARVDVGRPSADDEPGAGFFFAGLLAFEDPVREGVAAAVAVCRNAGIHTIMVTGDHPLTARAVAREIGLGGGAPTVVTADDLETRLPRRRPGDLRGVDVVARAAPSQKTALVRALQADGEIVAVTGDGVNDVPALQAADIGVAMGERGTRSAREAAAIVLLDDNFRTIVLAIGEGWQLFRNLRLSFQYLLIIHAPLVITAALIPLAGYPLLYLPVHIVWLETIIHPTALLVFQDLPSRHGLPGARERRPTRFFSGREWLMIATVGALITVVVTTAYLRSYAEDGGADHGRAVALAALTLSSATVTAVLSRLRTCSSRVIGGGTIALSVMLIQTPPLAALLRLEPLHLDDWVGAAAGSLIAAALVLVMSPHPRRRLR